MVPKVAWHSRQIWLSVREQLQKAVLLSIINIETLSADPAKAPLHAIFKRNQGPLERVHFCLSYEAVDSIRFESFKGVDFAFKKREDFFAALETRLAFFLTRFGISELEAPILASEIVNQHWSK